MNFDDMRPENMKLDYFSQTNQQLRKMESGGQDGCSTLIMLILVVIGLIWANC